MCVWQKNVGKRGLPFSFAQFLVSVGRYVLIVVETLLVTRLGGKLNAIYFLRSVWVLHDSVSWPACHCARM